MFYVYSHNDLDGVSCGIVAKCAFGDKAVVRYNSVEGLNGQVHYFLEKMQGKEAEEDFLFITDLSVNREIEQELNEYTEAGGRVKLIDHHKSALYLNEYPWAEVKVQEGAGRQASATSLFYKYLVEHNWMTRTRALDEYTELVRQYDTWDWERNDNIQAKRLNDLFFLVSIDEFEERMVARLMQKDAFSFDNFEEKILDMEEDKIERYLRRKRREVVQTLIDGLCAGIVHAESYHSELGNVLGKENPHLDYIAIVNIGGKRVSFRTVHDTVDVSEIAGGYGGGGHAKAAGCSLTDELFPLYVAQPFQIEPIRPDSFRNQYNLKGSERGALYENRDEAFFFLYPIQDEWVIECGLETGMKFGSFEEAERYVKRHHKAWLSRDEAYVKLLAEHWMQRKRALI